MLTLRRVREWASRLGHARGFGIQSPWAYSMLRNVIDKKNRHAACGALKREFPSLTRRERKICELCLRLSANLKPQTVVSFANTGDAFAAYFRAGSQGLRYVQVNCGSDDDINAAVMDDVGRIDAALLDAPAILSGIYEEACRKAHDGSVFIVLGINAGEEARERWRRITEKQPSVVTFDLYICGLVFFDSKRYKQNYKINF